MASQKEQTFTIKDVMGISRYYSATNTPPNKFYTIQNMHSPKRGELALLPGVSSNNLSLALASEVEDIAYLENSYGEEKYLIHYEVDASAITAPPTTFTFSSPTGTPTGTRDVVVEFLYPGGNRTFRTFTSVTYGTSSGQNYMTVSLPTSHTDIPTSVYGINYWIVDSSGSLRTWAGSHMRKTDGGGAYNIFPNHPNSTYPSEASFRLLINQLTTPTGVSNTINGTSPTGFSVTPVNSPSGRLESGRLYYFGIAQLVTQLNTARKNMVSLYTTTTSDGRMAAFLPSGYNSFTLSFNGVQATVPTSAGSTPAYAARLFQIFAGRSPELMAPIGGGYISAARPVYSTATTGTTTITANCLDCPYNTDQVMSMGDYSVPTSGSVSSLGVAVAGRQNGTWYNMFEYSGTPTDVTSMTRALVSVDQVDDISTITYKHQIPGWQYAFYARGVINANLPPFSALTSRQASSFWELNSENIPNSQQYGNQLLFANGTVNVYNTDGDLVLPLYGDDTVRVMPITENIALIKDRLVLGCGPTNWTYDAGLVFYSNAGVITNFGSGAGNYLNLNFGDPSEMLGFGVFSQDLSTVGPASFLLIGKKKSMYTWNGGTTTSDQQLTQIGKSAGWLSPKSYALTKDGPVVVTNQGLYLVSGSDMQSIDQGSESIFTDMAASLRPFVNCVYTGDRLVVGYASVTGLEGRLDRELWYDFRDEPDGSKSIVPTGPHVMKAYKGHIPYGINERLSWNSATALASATSIYRRDISDHFQNDGSDINVSIVFNETGLGVDEFVKILTRFYIRAKINEAISITFTATSRDSSSIGDGLDNTGSATSAVSETISLPYSGSGEDYRLYQKLLSTRYRGTIFNPTLSFSSGTDVRIVSMSLLYSMQRRRLL